MKHKIIKIIKYAAGIFLLMAAFVLIIFNFPRKTPDKKFDLGITYSARYAESIGLNEKKALQIILEDLEVKKVRIPVYWDMVEPEKNKYDFSNIDWQLEELASRKAKAILVIGQKVPRWPECHIPEWVGDDKGARYAELLELIQVIVEKYKGDNTVEYWQVENEPFLNFGVCPEIDPALLDLEIATVRAIDSNRKIVVTDSGELSTWIPAAKRADIFGTTMYRSVYTHRFGGIFFDYPIGPNFFRVKQWITRKFAKQENIMIVELQGEPWLDGWTTDKPLEKQLESMNEKKLRENVEFAQKTGFSPIYLWGVEWWYYLKESKDYPAVWEEAKKIFTEQSS